MIVVGVAHEHGVGVGKLPRQERLIGHQGPGQGGPGAAAAEVGIEDERTLPHGEGEPGDAEPA